MEEFEIEFDITPDEYEIDIEDKVLEIKPTLEDLEVTPTAELQEFKPVNAVGFEKVVVNPIKLQNKVVTPTQEEQIIIADEEFNGLGQVTIEKVEPVATKYKPRHISFYNYGGKELDEEVKNLDISNLESLQNLFYNSANLTSLDLSSWIVPNTITSISYMFYGCRKLEFLDIRTFQLTNITDTSYALSRVPTGCLIIVKDDECKSWFASKFSTYTNVKTIAEYEMESR